MESNNKSKKTDIRNCTCYYFNDIIKIEDFDLDYILIDEKSQEIILVYNISHESLIGAKPLPIRFDKIEESIRFYNGIKYLVSFGGKKYDFIQNRIRYLI